MPDSSPRYFAVVPAAGSGSRMKAGTPKQYLPLLGKPVLWHALAALCGVGRIARVYVVLSVDDIRWKTCDWSAFGDRVVPLFNGGATRAASVLAGLTAMVGEAHASDWVLVHDAARPCLAGWHVEKLIRELYDNEVGGLLATPVADTLKLADVHGRVVKTVDRGQIWQAQTPQMFRYVMLKRALEATTGVTDEAGAIEAVGLHPQLVQSDASNLKVTLPFDLHMAEWILHNRME